MNGKWNMALGIFGIFMVIVYLGAGLYILLTKAFSYVPSEVRIIFGSFLIIYGIFRGVRLYFKFKNPEE